MHDKLTLKTGGGDDMKNTKQLFDEIVVYYKDDNEYLTWHKGTSSILSPKHILKPKTWEFKDIYKCVKCELPKAHKLELIKFAIKCVRIKKRP